MNEIIKNENFDWTNIESYEMKNFPWDSKDYIPVTNVQMFYTSSSFVVRFIATEKELKVTNFTINSPVYKDSCVECFLNPDPSNSNVYFNFEINALGIVLAQIGTTIYERDFLTNEDISLLKIKSNVTKETIEKFNNFKEWIITLEIPFELIKRYYPTFKIEDCEYIKGNFYKCGDETLIPHYGCLYPIDYPKPSFHRPEFFKNIYLKH
ncbi:MAG: carbohydrate-binding family 9-like protein [Sarcina sp.]